MSRNKGVAVWRVFIVISPWGGGFIEHFGGIDSAWDGKSRYVHGLLDAVPLASYRG
jgi:hypothetical protein